MKLDIPWINTEANLFPKKCVRNQDRCSKSEQGVLCQKRVFQIWIECSELIQGVPELGQRSKKLENVKFSKVKSV